LKLKYSGGRIPSLVATTCYLKIKFFVSNWLRPGPERVHSKLPYNPAVLSTKLNTGSAGEIVTPETMANAGQKSGIKLGKKKKASRNREAAWARTLSDGFFP
jgi:hypothetical protein